MKFNLYKSIFIFSLVIVGFNFAQNQKSNSIIGSVISESTKEPLEFVNVALISSKDSSIISGAATDGKGIFVIKNVNQGEYFINYSYISYMDKKSSKFTLTSKSKTLDLGTTSLEISDLNMDEVTIASNKIIMNNSIDRKTYNVSQDVMSKTGSVSDLLQNIPSVQVDIDGNVSLRGSNNVMILINGKPSALMGKNRAEVLQQMPASSIEKIEVITNPSAKYKPDGTSGMINIVMNKESSSGFNGNLAAYAGNNDRYSSNLNFNYNPGSLNLFGTFSIRKDNRIRSSFDSRIMRDSLANISSFYNSDYISKANPLSLGGNLGFEYTLDPSNSFGVSGSYYDRDQTKNDDTKYILKDNSKVVYEDYKRVRLDYEYENEKQIEAFWQHDFEDEDHNLRLEFKSSSGPETEDNHYTNIYYVPQHKQNEFDNTIIKQTDGETNVTLDYSKPLSENSTFETGYAGEFDRTDLDFFVEVFNPTLNKFVTDTKMTNHFIFNETIHALYATYSNVIGDLSYLAGLRAEESFIKSDLVIQDSVLNNDYFSLYPTLHLAYKLSKVSQLQLNYSRRANRPEGDDLNPFPEYRDPRNVRAGNPHLKPEFIHSVEFGWQWQNDYLNIIPSIFYRNKYNGFSSVTQAVNDTTLLTTMVNLVKAESAGFELVVTGNIGKYFSTNLSTNAYYEQIDASNLGFSSNKSTLTWSSKINCNLNLPSGTMIQLNSYFRSARLTPQGESKSNFVVNLGFRQDLLKDKLTTIFTISDIFKTKTEDRIFDTPWMYQTSSNTRDSQIIYFGLTYHFGSNDKKLKDKSLQYDEN